MSNVVWHDVEYGAYDADLPLWRELAAAHGGPVLEVGAGTGRVARDLAAHGHAVVALDCDADLLAALRRRTRGLDVATVEADARSFALSGRTFPLILVPMQTVQLLDVSGRAAFLRAARTHLAPGGLLACAIVEEYDTFDLRYHDAATPDVREVDGVVYTSQPVALREDGEGCTIERVRETSAPDGHCTIVTDLIRLHRVDRATLEREARTAGLWPQPARLIDETADHVASTVVMLRG